MKEIFSFRDVEQRRRDSLRKHFQKKAKRLRRMVPSSQRGSAQLRVTIQGPTGTDQRWDVRAVLRLSTGTLVAEAEAQRHVESALEELADELWAGLRRHRQLVRKEFTYADRRRRREALQVVEPLLHRDLDRNRKESFFELLRPQLAFLHEHAHREVHLLEIEKKLRRNEIAPDDVVDETVLRAWHGFRTRPRDLPLEDWLMRIFEKVIESKLREEKEERVEDAEEIERPARATGEPDEDWWDRHMLATPEESIIWEDLLIDERFHEPAEEMSEEEERTAILKALADVPLSDRVAFTLHVLDGLELDEIARIQERNLDVVRMSIDVVRSRLLKRPTA